MTASLLITIVLTVFISMFFYYVGKSGFGATKQDAYRAVFLPLFLGQVFLVTFLGTGAVSGGIMQEHDDGMLEYQRLSPMNPMTKILGYLFGLPIREWFLFGLTMVAMSIVILEGNLPLGAVFRVYSALILSALIYHLMALVVVQSMKRKRLAGRMIQLIVVLFYLVLPVLSFTGFVFFEFLTVRPLLKDELLAYLPSHSVFVRALQFDGGSSVVPFFSHQLSCWTFALMLQGSILVTLVVMLYRRWWDQTSHLMSKAYAVGFYAAIALLLFGNTLPIAQNGQIGISYRVHQRQVELYKTAMDEKLKDEGLTGLQRQEIIDFYRQRINEHQNPASEHFKPLEDALMQMVFGMVCLLLASLVIYIMTPVTEKYVIGLRRSRNRGLKKTPLLWDESLGFWPVVLVLVVMALAVYLFCTTLYQVPHTMIANDVSEVLWMSVAYLVVAGFAFYLTFCVWEQRGVFLLVLLGWIVPILVAIIVLVATQDDKLAIWVSAISPFTGYAYSMVDYVDSPEQEAFRFSLIVHMVFMLYVAAKSHRMHAVLREKVYQSES